MILRITAQWISVAAALLLALLLGGTLFAGTVSAQDFGHATTFGMHGKMGYRMGATTTLTDTTAYGYPHHRWGMYGMMDSDMMGMMGYRMEMSATTTGTTTYDYPNRSWGVYGMMGYPMGSMPCDPAAGHWGMPNVMGGMGPVP